METSGSSSSMFCQFITPSAFHQGKLKIPNKFVALHGDNLSEMVKLSVPVGGCWEVGVKRERNGNIWLHDGFLTFMEDNGVTTWYSLVFKHQGDSKFLVLIYDLTAKEIMYKAVSEIRMDENKDEGACSAIYVSSDTDSDDSSFEFSGYTPQPSESASKYRENEGTSRPTYVSSDTDSDDSSFEFSGYTPRPSESASKYRENEGTSRGTTRAGRGYLTRSRRQRMEGGLVTNGRNMGEAGAANKFSRKTKQSADARDGRNNISPPETVQPRVPNSFQLLIESHHLSKGVARLPCDFARAHKLFSTRNIKIFDSNHEWELLYDCKPNVSSYMLMKKWHHFVQDNGLAEGDICVFEAVGSGEDCKLKVNIIRRIPTQGETLPSARKPHKRRCTRCFVYGHKRANCIEIP